MLQNITERKLQKISNAIKTAKIWSNLSECCRKQVGCIIISEDFGQIHAFGYNGGYPGAKKCSIETTPCKCTHAELNSLIKLSPNVGKNLMLFSTLSPCRNCAQAILITNAIDTVFYDEEYRLTDGIELLIEQKIQVYHFNTFSKNLLNKNKWTI